MAGTLKDVACCGFVCTACSEALPENAGCPGCRAGGGEPDCRQRLCCGDRGIDGCWQCADFPCDRGFRADGHDPAFRGFWLASVRCLREHGLRQYVSMVESRLGAAFDHAAFRGKSEGEIVQILKGAGCPQHPEPRTRHQSSESNRGSSSHGMV